MGMDMIMDIIMDIIMGMVLGIMMRMKKGSHGGNELFKMTLNSILVANGTINLY
jgi:hypothetical protein